MKYLILLFVPVVALAGGPMYSNDAYMDIALRMAALAAAPADGECKHGSDDACKECYREAVDGEAVEVVATVNISFDEDEEGLAIERVELHMLLDEGDTELMTVAQHHRRRSARVQRLRQSVVLAPQRRPATTHRQQPHGQESLTAT